MKKEKYIINGRTFASYQQAVNYANENGYRISHTEEIRKGIYLLTVTSIAPSGFPHAYFEN